MFTSALGKYSLVTSWGYSNGLKTYFPLSIDFYSQSTTLPGKFHPSLWPPYTPVTPRFLSLSQTFSWGADKTF